MPCVEGTTSKVTTDQALLQRLVICSFCQVDSSDEQWSFKIVYHKDSQHLTLYSVSTMYFLVEVDALERVESTSDADSTSLHFKSGVYCYLIDCIREMYIRFPAL